MIKRLWILVVIMLLMACAGRQPDVPMTTLSYEEDQEDVPSPVTSSPVPCLFFKW